LGRKAYSLVFRDFLSGGWRENLQGLESGSPAAGDLFSKGWRFNLEVQVNTNTKKGA
jgi:hypothetical protein